jgi:pimeloyl-ACP methyl ester carboxylesterase
MADPTHPSDWLGLPAPRELVVAGARFPLVSLGSGPGVLFVHGAWADLRIWCGLARRIAARNTFFAITQRHFGTNAWPADRPFSNEVHFEDLIAILRALDGPVHLVGWSYSGGLLLRAAAKAPDCLLSLLIYEPALQLAAPPQAEELQRAAESFWGALAPAYALARARDHHRALQYGIEIVFGLGQGGFTRLDPRVRRVFLDNAHAMLPDLDAPAAPPLRRSDLRSVGCPARIVVGARTWPHYRMIAGAVEGGLPRASLLQIGGTGHGGPVEQPDRFADAVLDFVGSRRA